VAGGSYEKRRKKITVLNLRAKKKKIPQKKNEKNLIAIRIRIRKTTLKKRENRERRKIIRLLYYYTLVSN